MKTSEWIRTLSAPEGLPLLHTCLLFNNHLNRAAPVVRLKDLSQKLCINPNSQFTINLYRVVLRCVKPSTSASKNKWMDDSAVGAIFWRDAGINSARDSHSALWVFSSHWVYIGCTLVFVGLISDTALNILGSIKILARVLPGPYGHPIYIFRLKHSH